MESTIIVAGIALVVGIIAGALLHKFFHAESLKNRRLESQIDQLNDQHMRYQAEVSSHFSQTAELLGRLNANYRDIFNHLAKGAEQLSNDAEFRVQAMNKLEHRRKSGNRNALKPEADFVDQPRDYAPKTNPEDKGMLSEDFGFRSGKSEPDMSTDKV